MIQRHSEDRATLFAVSDAWRAAYPRAHAGVLVVRNLVNSVSSAGLEQRRRLLEEELRARHAGQDRTSLLENPALRAYNAYYRRFDKTYHVQLQLESIIFKGKSIPTVAPLVDSMFMAELNNLLLTAGHDLDELRLPLMLDVARGSESYVLLRGTTQIPKAGDMMISDSEGVYPASCMVQTSELRSELKPAARCLRSMRPRA